MPEVVTLKFITTLNQMERMPATHQDIRPARSTQENYRNTRNEETRQYKGGMKAKESRKITKLSGAKV
jgi:hypothetical protein